MIAALILQATVTCSTVAAVTTCTDNRTQPLDSYSRALGVRPPPTYQELEAQNAAMRQARAVEAQRQLRTRVGALIADGQCKQAQDTALRGGDLDLAAQAKAACE